eukprot:scaffold219996_cov66-Attheya_sp.AAC.1
MISRVTKDNSEASWRRDVDGHILDAINEQQKGVTHLDQYKTDFLGVSGMFDQLYPAMSLWMEQACDVTKINFVFQNLVYINMVEGDVQCKKALILEELNIYQNKEGIFTEPFVWAQVDEAKAPYIFFEQFGSNVTKHTSTLSCNAPSAEGKSNRSSRIVTAANLKSDDITIKSMTTGGIKNAMMCGNLKLEERIDPRDVVLTWMVTDFS